MAASITAVFNARDRISSNLDNISRSGENASRSFGKLKAVGVASFVAIGAAVTATVTKSVTEFADFQGKMNEVFTLLPNISEAGMGKMTQQAKQFSKQMGVLPEKVVPALYQSISAGVPEENVFNFLETAQKAATGGVAELETAVDGLTSVVNSYGADTISAQKASDLMFTTVRLGKTDFKQLSSSIFNVLPSASAAGVTFEDVSAALAAITAQGVPTSVATTKVRAAIDELSKSGTKTSDLFKKLSGKTFKDFIKGGGDLQQAMQLLEKYANKSHLGINDLFSSVEAGSAALALTGKGTEKFTQAMNDMKNCAGATDAAYAKMDRGLGRTLERLKANFSVALLDIGEAIAPTIEKAGNALIEIIPYFMKVTEFLGKGISKIGQILAPGIDLAKNFVLGLINVFKGEDIITAFQPLYSAFNNIVDKLFPTETAHAIEEKFVGIFINIKLAFDDFVENTIPRFKEGFTNAFGSADFGGFVDSVRTTLGGVVGVFTDSILPATMEFVTNFWQYIGNGLSTLGQIFSEYVMPFAQQVMSAFNDNILPIIKDFGSYISDNIAPMFSQVFGFFADVIMPHVKEVASVVFPILGNIFTDACEIIKAVWDNVLKPVIDIIVATFEYAWPYVKGLVEAAVTTMTSVLGGLWTTLGGIIDFVTGVFTGNWSKAWEGVKEIFRGVFNTLAGIVKGPMNAVIGIINGAIEHINGISYDVPDWVPVFGGKHFGVNIPKIPMLAKGTDNWKGGQAIVGEAGAELVIGPQLGKLLSGSKVVPHDETLSLLKQISAATNSTPNFEDLANLVVPNIETPINESPQRLFNQLDDAPKEFALSDLPTNRDNSTQQGASKKIGKIELNINIPETRMPNWINDPKAFAIKVVDIIEKELEESGFEGGDVSIEY